MAAYISDKRRYKVIERAAHRCEYCQTDQQISGAQMHIEHIIPLVHGGQSDEENLCLACAWCNSYKGSQIKAYDPLTHEEVALFNPRVQTWLDHFRWQENGVEIMGLTPTGRVTVATLKMNNEYILPARRQWVLAGWHPPID